MQKSSNTSFIAQQVRSERESYLLKDFCRNLPVYSGIIANRNWDDLEQRSMLFPSATMKPQELGSAFTGYYKSMARNSWENSILQGHNQHSCQIEHRPNPQISRMGFHWKRA